MIAILVEDGGNASGASLRLLEHTYREAGFDWDRCRVRKVSSRVMRFGDPKSLFLVYKADHKVPNEQLAVDIDSTWGWLKDTKPSIVIAHGDLATYALNGLMKSASFRGSQTTITVNDHETPLMTTYAPAMVIKRWDWRPIMSVDLKRAKRMLDLGYHYPDYHFTVRPTAQECFTILGDLLYRANTSPTPVELAFDIETIARHMACIGIAWSATEAICIPLITKDNDDHNYFTEWEEVQITQMLRELQQHPNTIIIGQNYSYDTQFYARYWGYVPTNVVDTMTIQHTLFPGMPKALDFLSSMYCKFHVYWKDELKDYKRLPADEHVFWQYNCKDCVITFEAYQALKQLTIDLGFSEQVAFQLDLFYPVMQMMLRGVRMNLKLKGTISMELLDSIYEREMLIKDLLGETINVKSPKQMQKLFYEDLGLPVQKARTPAGYRPTTNGEALGKLAIKEPLIVPIVQAIDEIRSLNIFLSNFANAALDPDDRIRCSYNVSGTETFRFSSSKSVFDTGANLQTIPAGTDDD